MKETRICIIGGGSRLWAIQFFKDLAYNKMTHGTVVLHDIDHKAAMNNVAVGEQTFRVNEAKEDSSLLLKITLRRLSRV